MVLPSPRAPEWRSPKTDKVTMSRPAAQYLPVSPKSTVSKAGNANSLPTFKSALEAHLAAPRVEYGVITGPHATRRIRRFEVSLVDPVKDRLELFELRLGQAVGQLLKLARKRAQVNTLPFLGFAKACIFGPAFPTAKTGALAGIRTRVSSELPPKKALTGSNAGPLHYQGLVQPYLSFNESSVKDTIMKAMFAISIGKEFNSIPYTIQRANAADRNISHETERSFVDLVLAAFITWGIYAIMLSAPAAKPMSEI